MPFRPYRRPYRAPEGAVTYRNPHTGRRGVTIRPQLFARQNAPEYKYSATRPRGGRVWKPAWRGGKWRRVTAPWERLRGGIWRRHRKTEYSPRWRSFSRSYWVGPNANWVGRRPPWTVWRESDLRGHP